MATTNPTPRIKAAKVVKPAARLSQNGRKQSARVSNEPANAEPRAAAIQAILDQVDANKLSEEEASAELKKMHPLSWQEVLQLLDWADFPEDFMMDRHLSTPRELDIF